MFDGLLPRANHSGGAQSGRAHHADPNRRRCHAVVAPSPLWPHV